MHTHWRYKIGWVWLFFIIPSFLSATLPVTINWQFPTPWLGRNLRYFDFMRAFWTGFATKITRHFALYLNSYDKDLLSSTFWQQKHQENQFCRQVIFASNINNFWHQSVRRARSPVRLTIKSRCNWSKNNRKPYNRWRAFMSAEYFGDIGYQ